MRNYLIYIKSHAIDYPDFETEMEAKDFKDLQKKFGNLGDYELQRTDAICMNCFDNAENEIIKCNH